MIGQLSIDFLIKQADDLFSQGDVSKIVSDLEKDGIKVIDDRGKYKISAMLNMMGELSYELLKKKYNLPDNYFYPLTVMSHCAWELDIEIRDGLSSSEIKRKILSAIKSIRKQFKNREYKKIKNDEFMGVAFLLCLKIKDTIYGDHIVSIDKMEIKGDQNGTKIRVEYKKDKSNPIEYSG